MRERAWLEIRAYLSLSYHSSTDSTAIGVGTCIRAVAEVQRRQIHPRTPAPRRRAVNVPHDTQRSTRISHPPSSALVQTSSPACIAHLTPARRHTRSYTRASTVNRTAVSSFIGLHTCQTSPALPSYRLTGLGSVNRTVQHTGAHSSAYSGRPTSPHPEFREQTHFREHLPHPLLRSSCIYPA